MSKAFTGLLLNTFFFMKNIPIVKTLQDIRENKNLLITGNSLTLSAISKFNKVDINDIITRIKENNYSQSPIRKVIELVINGGGVAPLQHYL